MITFCPSCSNLLQVSGGPEEPHSFECVTCPYRYLIGNGMRVFDRTYQEKKQLDDVLGGQGAWDNVDQTGILCPQKECEGGKAYFYQLQIRSADEPMTTFYKCVLCGHQWREN